MPWLGIHGGELATQKCEYIIRMYKTLDRYFGDQNEKESPYANIARAKSRTCSIGKGAGGEETGRRALRSFKVEFTPERWVAFFFRLSD